MQTIVHRLNNLTTSASQYVVTPSQCREAFDLLSEEEPTVDGRIKTFAVEAQRKSVVDVEIEILGGGRLVLPLVSVLVSNIVFTVPVL